MSTVFGGLLLGLVGVSSAAGMSGSDGSSGSVASGPGVDGILESLVSMCDAPVASMMSSSKSFSSVDALSDSWILTLYPSGAVETSSS